jgi:tetratricopeptide (TPR) repeat protein
LSSGRRAEAKLLLQQIIANAAVKIQEKSEDEAAVASRKRNGGNPSSAPSAPSPPTQAWADLLMGVIQFEEGDVDAALISLLKAESADPRLPDLHLRIGQAYLRLRRTDDAERAFSRALEIDGDSPEAHVGLAMVRLRQRRNEEAAEQALLAVGLQHYLPLGHHYLGVALARLGHRGRAVLAFEAAASIMPGLVAAHRWLATLFMQPGGDPEKAARHRSIYLQLANRRRSLTHGN